MIIPKFAYIMFTISLMIATPLVIIDLLWVGFLEGVMITSLMIGITQKGISEVKER